MSGPGVPAPPVAMQQTGLTAPTHNNFPFLWDQLAAPTHAQSPVNFPMFAPPPGVSPLMSNGSDAMHAFACAMMSQPALFQQWAQHAGMYGVPSMGTPQHLSTTIPLHADFTSSLSQLSPAMSMPTSSAHNYLGSMQNFISSPATTTAPSLAVTMHSGESALTPQSITGQTSSLSPLINNNSAGLSPSAAYSSPDHGGQCASGSVNNSTSALPANASASVRTQQPGASVAGDVHEAVANTLSVATEPHADHMVRFTTDVREGDDLGPVSSAAGPASTSRPQRHRRAPTNPDGTRPVNPPGSRSSCAANSEPMVDVLADVGAKRKRSGSGLENRKHKPL